MHLQAHKDGRMFEIRLDEMSGFYVWAYDEVGNDTHDYHQDSLRMAKVCAQNEFGVQEDSWKLVVENENVKFHSDLYWHDSNLRKLTCSIGENSENSLEMEIDWYDIGSFSLVFKGIQDFNTELGFNIVPTAVISDASAEYLGAGVSSYKLGLISGVLEFSSREVVLVNGDESTQVVVDEI